MRTSVVVVVAAVAAIFCGTAAQAVPLPKPRSATIKQLVPTQAELDDRLIRDIRCLRDTIYTEARGENEYGQAMVAFTLLNRYRQARGKTICDLAYQVDKRNGKMVSQFSGNIHHMVTLQDDDPKLRPFAKMAVWVLLGYFTPLPQHRCVIAYQRIEHADPKRQGWFTTLQMVGKVGNHTFYCASTVLASK